ncbi:MAG: hypothetical protein U9P14_10230, partial [Gemmatimonadota bacterium]|nr:hypothetical protein [Gemmatimonadota bacterium]
MEIISSYLAAGWGAVVLRPSYLNGKQKQGSGSERSVRYPLYRGTDYEEKRMADLGWIESRDQVPIEETERIIGTLKERFSRSMVIGSMIGSSRDEWLKISRRLSQAGADMIECDMTSCISGGVVDAGELKQMEKVAGYLRDGARNTPVVVKLPGLLSGRREVAATLKQAGADALNIYYEPRGIPGINLANFVPFPNVGQKSALCMMGGAAVKPYTLAMLAQWGKVEPGLPLSVLGG